EVADQDLRFPRLDDVECPKRRRGAPDVRPPIAQQHRSNIEGVGIIVDDEDAQIAERVAASAEGGLAGGGLAARRRAPLPLAGPGNPGAAARRRQAQKEGPRARARAPARREPACSSCPPAGTDRTRTARPRERFP